LTVDQPQVKGAHVRFKKLVQIGESWFFQSYLWFLRRKSRPRELLSCCCCIVMWIFVKSSWTFLVLSSFTLLHHHVLLCTSCWNFHSANTVVRQ